MLKASSRPKFDIRYGASNNARGLVGRTAYEVRLAPEKLQRVFTIKSLS